MKIFTNTNNIQAIRIELEQSDFYKELCIKYNQSKILIGNFGYIIVPNNILDPVRKIYISEVYYTIEIDNYVLFKQNEICIPKIIAHAKNDSLFNDYSWIEFENIRKYQPSFKNMIDIPADSISMLLGQMHKISFDEGKCNVHGNIHQSNFFVGEKHQIGIFDLVSTHRSHLEYDFASIYFNSDFNEDFIQKILEKYKYRQYFSYKRFYMYGLLKIKENIKGNIYLQEETKNYLKKMIYKLKIKLGNLI